MQHEGAAARTKGRRDAGEVDPRACLNERLPRRILEPELRGRRIFAVVNDAAGSRQWPRFIEHQPQPGIFDPPHPTGVDAVAARLTIDDAAERPGGKPGQPGHTSPEPRQQAADIELAAADADL